MGCSVHIGGAECLSYQRIHGERPDRICGGSFTKRRPMPGAKPVAWQRSNPLPRRETARKYFGSSFGAFHGDWRDVSLDAERKADGQKKMLPNGALKAP